MPVIHVALQDGFQNDTVVVRLGGAEVYRRDGLKTRMQIGLADRFDLDTAPGPAELRIEIPTRDTGATVSIQVPVIGERYVGISVTADGDVSYRSTDEPFRYA